MEQYTKLEKRRWIGIDTKKLKDTSKLELDVFRAISPL